MPERQPSGLAELVTAALLAAAPLAGIVWLLLKTDVFTTDSLFLILILLTISGVFGFDLVLEFYHRFLKGAATAAAPQAPVKVGAAPAVAPGETRTESGMVHDIQYFEAAVGHPNKSLVTFTPDGASASYLLTLCGNVRSQLRVRRRHQLTYRAGAGCNTLLSWEYL